eukprot:scaffold830_cov377-Prasinococcus_capsulatus_cf.AAC.20
MVKRPAESARIRGQSSSLDRDLRPPDHPMIGCVLPWGDLRHDTAESSSTTGVCVGADGTSFQNFTFKPYKDR